MRNSLTLAMHRKCADEFERLRADRLCPGHGPVFDIPETAYAEHRRFVEDKEALWRDVLPEPAEVGIDLFWARLVPYQVRLASGSRTAVELELGNPFEARVLVAVHLRSPSPLDLPGDARQVWLDAGSKATLAFDVGAGRVTPDRHRRHLLFAPVDVDGRARGPLTEALVVVA